MNSEKKDEIPDIPAMEPLQKPNYMLMSIQRIIVLFIILCCVVVIVHYTPMPEEYFESCDRVCNELDWPMICRVKLVVEVYKTFSKSCGSCTTDGGPCPSTCVSGDGRERGILSVNRGLPAPALHVCHNDILVVDVVHRAPSHALALHWRGQPQKETPFMDGAPMLTQCPQPAYTTFQYKFRASAVGTHMYHAHSAADAADGLAGAFVVRQSPRLDSIHRLYDVDSAEHTIFIAEWGHSMGPLAGISSDVPRAESLLINGKGKSKEKSSNALSKFLVSPGKRYRFRMIYGGGAKGCPVKMSISEHIVKLVALDGHSIEPVNVESIEINRGERADFILKADKDSSTYSINIIASETCQKDLKGEAELVYDGNTENAIRKDITDKAKLFSSVSSDSCASDNIICLNELKSSHRLPKQLSGSVDVVLYIPFNYSTRKISESVIERWGETDGRRFTYPESPLLTQGSTLRNRNAKEEEQCKEGDECVHIKPVPLGSTVEIIMFDQGGESDHTFHLHGYSFYVTGIREFNRTMQKDQILQMNEDGTLFSERNLIDPVIKDTISIPKYGVVSLRFKADNPGYWLMRDERSPHWTRGLDFVLKVGEEEDFVKPPPDFPKCGSYVGPEFFLI